MAVHALGYVAAISEQDLEAHRFRGLCRNHADRQVRASKAPTRIELHGTPGYREVLVNAAGRPVERQGAFTPKLNIRQPIAGADLILSLDMRVQRAAEDGA